MDIRRRRLLRRYVIVYVIIQNGDECQWRHLVRSGDSFDRLQRQRSADDAQQRHLSTGARGGAVLVEVPEPAELRLFQLERHFPTVRTLYLRPLRLPLRSRMHSLRGHKGSSIRAFISSTVKPRLTWARWHATSVNTRLKRSR